VKVPAFLVGLARYPHDAQCRLLATHIAQQQCQQPFRIEPIGLRAARAPVHLDARRIHHQVRDTDARQLPVHPKPIQPGFIATDHRRVRTHSESSLAGRDLFSNPPPRIRSHRPPARRPADPRGKAQFPFPSTELQGH
jgi:hypothetical protein